MQTCKKKFRIGEGQVDKSKFLIDLTWIGNTEIMKNCWNKSELGKKLNTNTYMKKAK
jgi:hypothetical protein